MNANVDRMNKPSPTSNNNPSANDSDQDFDPSAEMLINDFDDEHTLEEEEANDDCSNITNEIMDLKKEGEMPLEELLALYGYEQSGNKAEKSAAQDASQKVSTNHVDDKGGDNSGNNSEDTTAANASQDSQLNQSATTSAASLPATSTRSSKHLDELPSHWTLPATAAAPLTNTNLLIDQEGSDMEDEEEEEEEEDEDDDEDDEEEDEGVDDWRRTIQVGSDYQAVIPDGLNGYGNVPPYENEDKLLWDPSVLHEEVVINFLRQITSMDGTTNSDSLSTPGANGSNDLSSVPSSTSSSTTSVVPLRDITNLPITSSIRDDEVALYLLHQCGHNVEEALRRKRMQQNSPFETMSPWSEEECINFEDGIRLYGKDFHQIQKNKVSTRSVGELVQFYYLWKKTERHDMYASKWRVEKKKYSLHPGTTDYMDRFIDEQENLALQAHSMSSSNYTRQQSHGSYSIIHYNHSSSAGGGPQSSNSSSTTTTSTITATTKETDNLTEYSDSHHANGSGGLNIAKTANLTTTSSSSASTTTSSSSTISVTSAPSNNGSESLTRNAGVSDSTNESLTSGLSRENVKSNSSNSNLSKTTSASDLFSPLSKMRMNIVDR